MKNQCVYQKFEETAEVYPDRIAVEGCMQTITYRTLNQAADSVADSLRAQGIRHGRIVAVYFDSSLSYIAAILGVMKSGGIFMPVNTGFPPHQLSAVLKKINPDAFIIDQPLESDCCDKLDKSTLTCMVDNVFVLDDTMILRRVRMNSSSHSLNTLPDKHINSESEAGDSCYVITTSGSTGEPKAIMGSHKGLAHFVSWERAEFGLNEDTRCSQLSPVTFDVSLRDIFVPLTCGGTVCIPDDDIKRSPEKLITWFDERDITLTHIVPTLFRMLTQELSDRTGEKTILSALKHALIAGEMLYGNDVVNWWEAVGHHVELVNLYGPSETTLAKLYYRIKKNGFKPMEVIPVGKPIPDTEVNVIHSQKLCLPGERGEVYIKTPYMSNGYFNAPELNKRAFIQDPVSGEAEAPSVVYKTGDMGFIRADGNLQLTGRIDGQIKLHGKRIETGEIEVVLMRHPAIKNAAVTDWADATANRRLVGYIVTDEETVIPVESLRKFSKQHLPEYMVPNIFVNLKSLPLNHNGKVDRKALPVPIQKRPEMVQNFEPASTQTEKTVATVWAEALCIDDVGVHDNFFDLGGNSILVVSVLDALNREFQVSLDAVTLFEYPTIRMLSDYLSKNNRESFSINQLQNRGRLRQVSMKRRIRPEAGV